DEQVVARNPDLLRAQPLDLTNDRDRINDDAVADDARFSRTQNPRRDQVQHVFFLAQNDGVPRVVAALRADDDVRIFGQKINDLALAFVAPLSADENRVGHVKKWFGLKNEKTSQRPAVSFSVAAESMLPVAETAGRRDVGRC